MAGVSWRVLVNSVLLLTVLGNFCFLYSMYHAPRAIPQDDGRPLDFTAVDDGNSNHPPIEEGQVHVDANSPPARGQHQGSKNNASPVTATTTTTTAAPASSELHITAMSSKALARVTVDGKSVLEVGEAAGEAGRGLHVVVINPRTGAAMDTTKFDTYVEGADTRLLTYLKAIHPHRIVALAVRDEASFHLGDEARLALINMGSLKIGQLNWRDTWAMITQVGHPQHTRDALGRAPDFNHWGRDVQVVVDFERTQSMHACDWPKTPEFNKRRRFCDQYDGYGDLCSCEDPRSLTFPGTTPFPALATTPVVVMASENRAKYLLRSLTSLLRAEGCNRDRITVSIDGVTNAEAEDVCHLLGVGVMRHTPVSEKNGRITQHYRFALTAMFDRFPDAEHLIVIEEDLDAAPDFFKYFATTLPLLERDPTLYCISAWNDQGYKHSSQDSTLLYRVETMPGLGWLLSRRLYKEELEPKWPTPDKLWDWDMWMRMNDNRKDRECIIPDVSRTFHFGATGLNVNDYFQKLYFAQHRLNDDAGAVVKIAEMTAKAYDAALHRFLESAHVLDPSRPCKEMLPSSMHNSNTPLALYMQMRAAGDYTTWLQLAKCWKLWDLDVRGFHKGVWRFFHKGNPIAVVGVPYSPFSSHKPASVEPLLMQAPKKGDNGAQ